MRLLLAVLAGASLAGCGSGKLELQDEAVKTAWSSAVREYQRRLDLVPDLIAELQAQEGEAVHGLAELAAARETITTLPLNAGLLEDAPAFARMEAAQESLAQQLRALWGAAEKDATLVATQDFRDLRGQFRDAEIRIAMARDRYDVAVRAYNESVNSFPTNVTAGMFDYQKKPGFTPRKRAM